MTEPLVLVDRSTAGLAVLTLDRPQAMNALSVGLMTELTRCITRLTSDPDVRVLLLTGADLVEERREAVRSRNGGG